MKRGQVWSMDLIIGVLIFLLAVGVFYFFTSNKASTDQSKLQIESQLVADKLTSDKDLTILNGTAVDENKLNDLTNLSYADLKEKLGLQDDFCIVITDQNGSIILIGNSTTGTLVGLGNGNLTLNLTGTNGAPIPCGANYTAP